MVSSRDFPSPAKLFSTYASMMGFVMMVKPMVYTLIPVPVQNYVATYIKSFIGSRKSTLTLVISEKSGMKRNALFSAAQAYLSSKINNDASRLRITKDPNNKSVDLQHSPGEIISDLYQGIELKWQYLAGTNTTTTPMVQDVGQYEDPFSSEGFELSFDKKHKDLVLKSYVPYVESKSKAIKDERRILKMYSYSQYGCTWTAVNFEHPSTFDTMAMNNEKKRSVMEDLDRFIKRKEFYKRVGKAWKRGYLLYGPPGTGKTSLVAAMANYLKFDLYDLQLANVRGDADLRSLLLGVKNSSILIIEDIDCSVDLPTRLQPAIPTPQLPQLPQLPQFTRRVYNPYDIPPQDATPLTLSGLLNCIDGLWSSCGNERIIIFTTNNKEILDPALLRPGRMDMHIYMGHCGFDGFKTLASNYLGLPEDTDDNPHPLYPDIKHLIDGQVLTPAQVAEELMKTEDVDMALEGLVKVLKRKRSEPESSDDEAKKKLKTVEQT